MFVTHVDEALDRSFRLERNALLCPAGRKRVKNVQRTCLSILTLLDIQALRNKSRVSQQIAETESVSRTQLDLENSESAEA